MQAFYCLWVSKYYIVHSLLDRAILEPSITLLPFCSLGCYDLGVCWRSANESLLPLVLSVLRQWFLHHLDRLRYPVEI